jgi:hypothetical protein
MGMPSTHVVAAADNSRKEVATAPAEAEDDEILIFLRTRRDGKRKTKRVQEQNDKANDRAEPLVLSPLSSWCYISSTKMGKSFSPKPPSS